MLTTNYISTMLSISTVLYLLYTSYSEKKPNHNSYGYGCHRLGSSQSSQNARMPQLLACTAFYVSKMGPKTSQE